MAERTITECDFCGQPMLHGCINVGNLQFHITCSEFQMEGLEVTKSKDICDRCLRIKLSEWLSHPEYELQEQEITHE
jgi:hypothetical protein